MPEEVLPPSLAWVPGFVASANRALDGYIVRAEVEGRTDPLQWVLVLTSEFSWSVPLVSGLRKVLQDWCKTNRAEYKRSDWERNVFKALILVRGLGPEMNLNPYEEDSDAAKRAARRLE